MYDRILTLSTCTGRGHATRWVVQAVLRGEAPPEPEETAEQEPAAEETKEETPSALDIVLNSATGKTAEPES